LLDDEGTDLIEKNLLSDFLFSIGAFSAGDTLSSTSFERDRVKSFITSFDFSGKSCLLKLFWVSVHQLCPAKEKSNEQDTK